MPPGQAKKAAATAQTGRAQPPGQAKKTAASSAKAPANGKPSRGRHGRAAHPLPPTAHAPMVSAVHAPAPAPRATVRTASAFRASGGAHHRARRPRHRSAPRHHHALAATPVRPAATPAKTAVPVSPAAARRPAAPRHRLRTHTPARRQRDSGGTAVVTPVFREIRDVVNVVPGLVWIAIGALAGLALLLALLSGLQTRRVAGLSRQRRALREDLDVLQAAVLPAVPASVGALEVSVAHRAAAGPAAGGDFHDVVALGNGRVALVVGDVAGHGRDAVAQAALVRFTLRAHLERGADARQALEIAASTLDDHFGEEGFATVAVAIYDAAAGTLTYSTAAHDAPIVLGPGAHEPVLASAGTPLGAGGRPARRRTIVPFGEGSVVCLLTDGAFEARTADGLVGRTQLADWLEELGAEASAARLVDCVIERASVNDDIAVCLARSRTGADSGRWRVEELHLPGGDATRGEAARFLAACGVGDAPAERALDDVAGAHGAVCVRVRLDEGRPAKVTVAADRRMLAVA
jgi:Stage II sporulation protein E (SpoIIE)